MNSKNKIIDLLMSKDKSNVLLGLTLARSKYTDFEVFEMIKQIQIKVRYNPVYEKGSILKNQDGESLLTTILKDEIYYQIKCEEEPLPYLLFNNNATLDEIENNIKNINNRASL